ncbi:hypothetical protein [Streptomyces sp. NPDC002044]|uniref:hypothetical protein n=1 Tax=Streptomyces sp. NPDC002044 TaxID=3154662 RepID=UPI0033266256
MSPDSSSSNTNEVPSEMARLCPHCETVFTVADRTSRRVFCSPTCREQNRRRIPVQRTCPQCGNEFTTDISPRRIFCSTECRTTARGSENARESRTCPVCDNTFDSPKTIRKVYCSPTCRRNAERYRDQAREQDRARRLGETPHPAAASPPVMPGLPTTPKPATRAAYRPAPERDPLEPTATRNCPHCQQPVTIVALLATPEVARPSMPTGLPDVVPLRRAP